VRLSRPLLGAAGRAQALRPRHPARARTAGRSRRRRHRDAELSYEELRVQLSARSGAQRGPAEAAEDVLLRLSRALLLRPVRVGRLRPRQPAAASGASVPPALDGGGWPVAL